MFQHWNGIKNRSWWRCIKDISVQGSQSISPEKIAHFSSFSSLFSPKLAGLTFYFFIFFIFFRGTFLCGFVYKFAFLIKVSLCRKAFLSCILWSMSTLLISQGTKPSFGWAFWDKGHSTSTGDRQSKHPLFPGGVKIKTSDPLPHLPWRRKASEVVEIPFKSHLIICHDFQSR